MGIMSRENESKYWKEKLPLLSCAMAIKPTSTTFFFAFHFVSHASFRCCAAFVDYSNLPTKSLLVVKNRVIREREDT